MASTPSVVTLVVAQGCHLCEQARADLAALAGELGFEVEELDITGDEELERVYRVFVPVVEVAGEQVSFFGVEEGPLRHKLGLPGRDRDEANPHG